MSFLRELLPWSSRGREMLTFTDRLNSRYSVFLLVLLGSVVGLSQMLGRFPITCNVPAQFTDSGVAYAHRVCWLSGKFYLPLDRSTTTPGPSKSSADEAAGARVFAKLHWIFILQAFLFYLPCALWKVIRRHPLIPLRTLADAACDYQQVKDAVSRDRMAQFMGKRFGQFLWEVKKDTMTQILTIWGHYLSISYLLIRFLYVVIISVNLHMILRLQGMASLPSIMQVRNYTDVDYTSPYFPHVVLCDYDIRILGTLTRYTVQCLLDRNEILQQLVMFVGCWYLFVACVNIWALIEFFISAIFIPCCKGGVESTLKSLNKSVDNVSGFTSFVGRDGALVARLVSDASSNLVSAEMIGGAWELYKERSGNDVTPGGLVIAGPPLPQQQPIAAAATNEQIPMQAKGDAPPMYPKLA